MTSGDCRRFLGSFALAAMLTTGCRTGPPSPSPFASPRLVAAHRGAGDSLIIRMSEDGVFWTADVPTMVGGAPATTVAEPAIFYDGRIYHLYWLDAGENVRYATSGDADSWFVQGSALGQLSAAARPAFVRGGSQHFAFFRSATGAVQQVDLDNPNARATVPVTVSTRPTVAFGGGRWVLAAVDGASRAFVVTSTDARQWSAPQILGAAGAVAVGVSFSEGRFGLALKRQTSAGALPGRACAVFVSTDGIQWTERVPAPDCGNIPEEMVSLRYKGRDLVLTNVGDAAVFVSTDGAPLVETHFVRPLGRISYAAGPGPMLATFRLDRVRVIAGVRQDITIVSLGFHVRVGQPNSARVVYTGQLREFASDLGVGQEAAIPPLVSPTGWVVRRSAGSLAGAGSVDLMGGVEIGIDRGACPEGAVRDRVGAARTAFETALNLHLATATSGDLVNAATRNARIARIQCEVVATLEGRSPASCAISPPPPMTAARPVDVLFDAVANTLANDFWTNVGCGFNIDEQFDPAAIVFIGTDAFEEAPSPTTAFRLAFQEPNRPLDVFTIQNSAGTSRWTVNSTLRFLGIDQP
jgi:hypothetical protein